jgi:hypothetical protein
MILRSNGIEGLVFARIAVSSVLFVDCPAHSDR